MRVLLLLALLMTPAALALFGGLSLSKRAQLKNDILELANKTQRGLRINSEEEIRMQEMFSSLEKLNPNKNSLSSSLLNGTWDLQYTTSDAILSKKSSFKPVGKILQKLDLQKLTAENSEVIDYGLFKMPRKVTAELKPTSKSAVAVQFKEFSFFNWLKVKAPASFKGTLDITYLDEDVRLSRGDKGNIFVLTKM